MSGTILSPYRTLSAGLTDIPRPDVRVLFGSAGPNPGAQDLGGGEYSLGSDSDWNPEIHDLTVSFELRNVAELRRLFGPSGLASADASLLLALEWTSAGSGWRGLGAPVRLTLDQLSSADMMIRPMLVLPAGSIRGTGLLTLQVFLGEPGSAERGDAGVARRKGARFGNLSGPFLVVVDSDGSLFPVLEEPLGQDQALWEMRDAWNDPCEEPFTSEYVALVLNRDHELFDQLRDRRDGNASQTPLMRHVLAAWISLLVLSVKADIGQEFDEFVAQPRAPCDEASIADAATMFVRSGELDTSTPHALFASVQRWLDRRVRPASSEDAS